jgi:hypothetical protein
VPHLRDFRRNLAEIRSNQSVLLRTYRSFHWEGHWIAPPVMECVRIVLLEHLAAWARGRAAECDRDLVEIERWAGERRSGKTWLLSPGRVEGWASAPPECRSALSDWRDRDAWGCCGTELPADDRTAANVVSVDLWRVLPWPHVSELLSEALRVGENACFVATAAHDAGFSPDPSLAAGGASFVEDAEWLAECVAELGRPPQLMRTPTAAAVLVSNP